MPLSKAPLSANSGPQVLEYKPPRIELGASDQAKEYLRSKAQKESSFKMSEVVRLQTGVSKIESQELDRKIEERVLERLKEIQEPAYQEAYQLGLEEGRKEAFNSQTQAIESRLASLDQLVESISNLKELLVQHNETHLIQLMFHMAKRLAFSEISADKESVIKAMREAIRLAQAEEEVLVQVNPEHLEFLETLKTQTNRELEFLKKLKFAPNESVSKGGCIIETNYGEIDARFEERVDKLWSSISENLYKVKPKISTGT